MAFYDKVVDIWYKFLASVRNDASVAENVGKAQLSEGMDMLTRVLNTRINLLGDTHIATVSATVLKGSVLNSRRLCSGPDGRLPRVEQDELREHARERFNVFTDIATAFLVVFAYDTC